MWPVGPAEALLIALLGAAEGVVAPTPLARYLGVLSFRARKADRGNEVDFGKPDAHFRRP